MTKLKYGCGPDGKTIRTPRSSARQDVTGNSSSTTTCPAEGEKLYEISKTCKDSAIENCVRLIIDVGLSTAVVSLRDLVERLPQHRLGNVEEIVYTRRAFQPPSRKKCEGWLAGIPSQVGQNGNHDEDVTSIPKIMRVVLHSVDNSEYNSLLQGMGNFNLSQPRRADRKPIQLVAYGVMLNYSLFSLK
jgi:hypothetical protein